MRVILFILILLQSLTFANNTNVLAIDILKKDGVLKNIDKNFVFFYKKDNFFPIVRILVDNSYKENSIQKDIKGIGTKYFYKQKSDCTIKGILGTCYQYTLTKDDIKNLTPKTPESLYIHDLTSMNSSSKAKEREYGKYLKENKLNRQKLYRVYIASNNPNIDNYIPLANGKLLNSGGFTHLIINIENKEEKILIEDTADYIIYIGHGSSYSGKLAGSATSDNGDARWNDTVSGESIYWKNVKGFLSFGCAIIDVGDFGNQNLLDNNKKDNCTIGSYCKNYYEQNNHIIDTPEKEKIAESPNPGLSWSNSMINNNIDLILGFNFKAPLVFGNGGDLMIERFLDLWIGGTDFLSSWKKTNLDLLGYVERGYLNKKNNIVYYSFAKTYGKYDLRWQKERTVDEALMFSNCFNNLHDMNFNQKKVYEICDIYRDGIIDGYSDKTYKSNNLVNRAEFTKFIIYAKYLKPSERKEIKQPRIKPFPDVEIGEWFTPFVNKSKKLNALNGKKDGLFHPSDNITLGEASKIVVRLFIDKNIEVKECEGKNDCHWADNFIEKLSAKAPDIKDKNKGYSPDKFLTREQTAYIISKVKG